MLDHPHLAPVVLVYVESDLPEGQTLVAWRAARENDRRERARQPWHRTLGARLRSSFRFGLPAWRVAPVTAARAVR